MVLAGELPTKLQALALEVINSKDAGRRILHFEDVIGPHARPDRAKKRKKVALVLAVSLDCAECDRDFEELTEVFKLAESQGGFVAVVVQSTPGEWERAREPLSTWTAKFPIALDVHGLSRYRLKLTGPRYAVVIRENGEIAGPFGPGDGGLERAKKLFLDELEESAQ